MKLYAIIYIVFSAIGIGLSIPIANHANISIFAIIGQHFASLLMCGIMSGFLCLLFRISLKKFFSNNLNFFKVFDFEIKFYDFLKIRAWKDRIPDLGGITNGFQKHLCGSIVKDEDYYKKFLYELSQAEILHFVSILVSPLCLFFIDPRLISTIGSTTLIIFFLFNILPVMVQRYNRPRILHLYDKFKEKNDKKTS